MAPPGQRTFVPVPKAVGIQSLLARPEGAAVVSHPPMRSREVQEAYRKRTRAAAPDPSTDVELRRQRLEAAHDKKERDKEKGAVKARAAREKKAEKERAEREEKKRLGLPLVGGGGMERRREVGGVELVRPLEAAPGADKENKNPEGEQPPAKRQKVEEGERKPMQRAPSRKRVFGQNLPLKVHVDAVRPVDQKQQRPSVSPSKKPPTELVQHAEENQHAPRRPSPKRDTGSPGSPAKKRFRSSPAAKEAARDRLDSAPSGRPLESKAAPAVSVPKMCTDTHKLEGKESEGKESAGIIGSDLRRAEQKLEKRRLTPAREDIPFSNRVMTTKSESKPASFSKPTSIAKSHPAPTAAPGARVFKTTPKSDNSASTGYSCARAGTQKPPKAGGIGDICEASTKDQPSNSASRNPAHRSAVRSFTGTLFQGTATSGTGAFFGGGTSKSSFTDGAPSWTTAHYPFKKASFAQPPQKPLTKPSTTLPAVPPQRPPVAYPKCSAHSRAPPTTAASFGYLPPAQPRGLPKRAAPRPAFVRPAHPQHSPTVPAFKSNNVSTGSTGFQKPKFLPNHIDPGTPTNPGMHTVGPKAGTVPPLSTQRFLEIYVDSVLPSPSQEERELQECSAVPPPRPAFIKPRPMVTSRPQPPPFKSRPPVPRFSKTPTPRPNPPPRQSSRVNPIRLQAVQQMDDSLPFFSTQDWAISSQDIREVEERVTPSKPPPKPRAELRPSPLGNNMPYLAEARPPPPILSSVAKGPARNIAPQRSSIQPSPVVQAGLPPRALPSVDKGPSRKGLLDQTLVQAANPRADSAKPTLSPFGSCSDRPRFFNTQESVDPQELMNLVAENIRACHGVEEERQRQQQDKAGGCGGDQGAGALLSQETDYGDLDLDAADLMDF
ncbi:hypothetical protein B0T18DRAFT_483701 [Schizothecium vesticola]|uniref:Uncharacterized protein n=1 Tax=Schizothecium vesticola TaxID=314040 RepID=A0AA40F7W8_9PEZI|nr:hypothetical protein B0T18DRAFT_483701 [Schizothecium vesticola]